MATNEARYRGGSALMVNTITPDCTNHELLLRTAVRAH
jgi:hypothetical protein